MPNEQWTWTPNNHQRDYGIWQLAEIERDEKTQKLYVAVVLIYAYYSEIIMCHKLQITYESHIKHFCYTHTPSHEHNLVVVSHIQRPKKCVILSFRANQKRRKTQTILHASSSERWIQSTIQTSSPQKMNFNRIEKRKKLKRNENTDRRLTISSILNSNRIRFWNVKIILKIHWSHVDQPRINRNSKFHIYKQLRPRVWVAIVLLIHNDP